MTSVQRTALQRFVYVTDNTPDSLHRLCDLSHLLLWLSLNICKYISAKDYLTHLHMQKLSLSLKDQKVGMCFTR